MNEKAALVLKEIENLSMREFLPIIGPLKGSYLIDTQKRVGAKTVLEIGTLVGYAAILMAENLPHGGIVHTIEIDPSLAHLARRNIEEAGVAGSVEIHTGDALDVIPLLDLAFDMIFIDASKEDYLKYLQLAESKLKTGGALFADNAGVFAGSMRDYLDYVRHSGAYKSEYHAVGSDGVEISLKL